MYMYVANYSNLHGILIVSLVSCIRSYVRIHKLFLMHKLHSYSISSIGYISFIIRNHSYGPLNAVEVFLGYLSVSIELHYTNSLVHCNVFKIQAVNMRIYVSYSYVHKLNHAITSLYGVTSKVTQ